MKRTGKSRIITLVGLWLCLASFLVAQAARKSGSSPAAPKTVPKAGAAKSASRARPAMSEAAVRDKIIRFVRARFGVPDNVTVTSEPLTPSIHPRFLQTVIVTDNGKEKHNNNVLITRDNRLLVIGSLVKVEKDPQEEVVPRLREQFKIPDTISITATPFHASTFPELVVTTVTVDQPKGKQNQDFYLTKDRQCLVLGSVFNLAVDPQKHALQTLNTMNSPSTGPRSARVTIVEFADLQCPTCSPMHDFLENVVLRKYGEKIRVVYKDFPLPSIHDWTLTATIANQCVYQINPSAYVPFRSMVFKNQTSVNAANVRDLVLSYGEQLGVDRLRLAACVDAKSTLPRIEESVKEGQAVGVQSTPTSFINGKMVVGMPTIDAYYKDIDEALKAAK